MAGVSVEAGSQLAQSIQSAVQPKLVENGWVAEENDTTLSEYVTMMVVNGKNTQGVQAELGGELLGVGEDDPAVGEFAQWLFQQVQALAGPAAPQSNGQVEMQQEAQDSEQVPSALDSQMDDAAPVEGAPSGPKAMRDGGAGRGRGRGGRILGQLNNHMTRDQALPDSLRRIKGAAGGQHGRINSHANRDGPPRGPKGQNLANGVQRMMNGGGRGGRGGMNNMNAMAQGGNMMGQLDPQQQMAFMQMMEMQANMMQQMLQGGQAPNFAQQNGGQNKSLFDRIDKRQQNGHFKGRQQRNGDSQNGDAASSMDVDSESGKKGDPFETECRFNTNCANPACPFAHQTPAAPPKPADQKLDMADTCPFGASCTNTKCTARHPSPASRNSSKQEVDCKFFPNCTNPNCPFRHPDMPPCRNGADCSIPGCKFTHSKISCRYNPCTKPSCPFKHVEGQKGVFKDKVWTAGEDGVPSLEGEGGGETANRFAGLKENEGQAEELIIPGGEASSSSQQLPAETQIMS